MAGKAIKLSPKKGGNGYISSYSVSIGISEIKEAGFMQDGVLLPVEKIIDPENNQIILKIKAEE